MRCIFFLLRECRLNSAEDPGRPDIYVEGLDRNRDGIPDILQQAMSRHPIVIETFLVDITKQMM